MNNNKRTKIIATLGPASQSESTIIALINEGVDVFRINFSHSTHEVHQKSINIIHRYNINNNSHIALLADLQGPKLRIGDVENNEVNLEDGKIITVTTKETLSSDSILSVNYKPLPKEIKPNDRILIDDGKILLKVVSTDNNQNIQALVVHGGVLTSKKGFNLPDTFISQSSLTDKDKEDLSFVMQNRFQWVALSFVRKASDIHELKKEILKYHKKNSPLVIAKIEKPEAINDIDNIINAADAVMVARGDLGIEIPMENVPLIQKMIVKKCLIASKPIIIATQLMESMISNYTPTRAEVNDVANNVMDGADAVMLSGETSIGMYPVNVVENVRKIILQAESFEGIYYKHNKPENIYSERFITDSICSNACLLAQEIDATAIISMTYSGYSAIKISSYRPKAPIYIFTNNHAILSKLNLVWGVTGFFYDKFISTDDTIEDLKQYLKKIKIISEGEKIINLASMPISEKGKINTLRLSKV
ncbi:MAG: pyruvate kinase [Bacteroidales bacterium]|nr:pyruvate kinase [Bacteroidales bacterium]